MTVMHFESSTVSLCCYIFLGLKLDIFRDNTARLALIETQAQPVSAEGNSVQIVIKYEVVMAADSQTSRLIDLTNW